MKYKLAKAVAALLKKGVDPNARDKSGNTPLHIAASVGSGTILRLLLDAGANVNASNRKKYLAINLTEDEGIRKMLIGAGSKQ